MPGFNNAVEDTLSKQPGEAGQPNDSDNGECGSRLYTLQDPLYFATIEDRLEMVASHLVLEDCVEAISTELSSGCPIVALACKICSRQHLDLGEYVKKGYTTYLYGCYGHKYDVAQVQGNPLIALRCQSMDNRLWVHKVPICRTQGKFQVSVKALELKLGYFILSLQ